MRLRGTELGAPRPGRVHAGGAAQEVARPTRSAPCYGRLFVDRRSGPRRPPPKERRCGDGNPLEQFAPRVRSLAWFVAISRTPKPPCFGVFAWRSTRAPSPGVAATGCRRWSATTLPWYGGGPVESQRSTDALRLDSTATPDIVIRVAEQGLDRWRRRRRRAPPTPSGYRPRWFQRRVRPSMS